MILLQLSDFVEGKYNIPEASSAISGNNTEVQAYIDDNEKKYIYKLLGVTLGDLVIAYIQGGSTGNTYYDKIIGSFGESTGTVCKYFRQSLGLKAYLQACIYYEYTKESYQQTLAGTVEQNAEVGNKVTASSTLRKAERVFNTMLDTAEAIQSVCREDSTNYAGFEGTPISVKGHQFFI